MSVSVAVSSPVFSPSKSIFCNKSPILSSPEALSLGLIPPSSPIRLQKPLAGSLLSFNSVSASSPSSSASVSVSVSGSSSGPPVLKRKRPARLDIPAVTAAAIGFGVPATPSVGMREVERDEDGYSVYCKKGKREVMEDRFSAAYNLQDDPKQVLFGIFDGHGGAKAADFAAQKLGKNILDEVVAKDEDDVKDAIKQGYLKTDEEFLKEDILGGTCCLTALIRKGNLAVSNAGDCRAVMCRAGVAEALTSDHRASRDDERDRVEALGGYVDFHRGAWRIQGSLAVSRGIGDGHLKQWVIAEPDTKIIRIEPEHEFLILASDGLWDKVSNQEAVDVARRLCGGTDNPNALLACKTLVDLSVSRGSLDDISVMVVHLQKYI